MLPQGGGSKPIPEPPAPPQPPPRAGLFAFTSSRQLSRAAPQQRAQQSHLQMDAVTPAERTVEDGLPPPGMPGEAAYSPGLPRSALRHSYCGTRPPAQLFHP